MKARRSWQELPGDEPTVLALLNLDMVGSGNLASLYPDARERAELLRLYHDAVEAVLEAYDGWLEPAPLRWAGEGTFLYFAGEEAVVQAVEAGLQIVEAVRAIPRYQVEVRVGIGMDEIRLAGDPGKALEQGFIYGGRVFEVCPPGALTISEEVYRELQERRPDLAKRFAYFGTTARNPVAVFVSPKTRSSYQSSGLLPRSEDPHEARERLFAYYSQHLGRLRFYRIKELNFLEGLDLLKIYTPLKLIQRVTSDIRSPESREEATRSKANGKPDGAVRSGKLDTEGFAKPIPFQEVFNRGGSMIVLGDTGSGKTTLLRYLALVFSGGLIEIRRRIGCTEQLLPIFVRVARLAELSRDKPGLPRHELLAAYFKEEDVPGLGGLFAGALSEGRGLLLFDGMDEIPDVGMRLAAAELLERIGRECAGNRIIVTSRPAGFVGLDLPKGETWLLAPLEPDQTRGLARALYEEFQKAAVEKTWRADEMADDLFGKLSSDTGLAHFGANPLLLTLAALVHIQQLGRLPRHRARLYDIVCQTLVEAWAELRRLDHAKVQVIDYDSEGMDVIPPLALWMHENCPGGVISESDLIEKIASRLPETKRADDDGARRMAREFLQKIEQAGALLIHRGGGSWSFLHQSFQEYLAAKAVTDSVQAWKDAVQDVEKLYGSRWEEVWRLACGELSIVRNRPAEATELISMIARDRHPILARRLNKNLVLAMRCLADSIRIEEKVVKQLTEDFANILLKQAFGPPEREIMSTLRTISNTPWASLAAWPFIEVLKMPDADDYVRWQAANALGEIGGKEAMDALSAALRSDAGTSVRFAAATAPGRIGGKEALEALREVLRSDADAIVRMEAAIALGEMGGKEATDALLAVLRSDADTTARRNATIALGKIRAREAVEELGALLGSSVDDDVRKAAARALGRIGTDKALKPLLDFFKRPKIKQSEPALYSTVAEALYKLGDLIAHRSAQARSRKRKTR